MNTIKSLIIMIVRKRFEHCSICSTRLYFVNFGRRQSTIHIFALLIGARIFPCIPSQNQKAAAIPKSLFYLAGDGSGCRRQPQKVFNCQLLKTFCIPIFSFSPKAKNEASFLDEEGETNEDKIFPLCQKIN